MLNCAVGTLDLRDNTAVRIRKCAKRGGEFLLRSCYGSAGSLQRFHRVGQAGTEEVLAQTLAEHFGDLFRVEPQFNFRWKIGEWGFQLVNITEHLLLRLIGELLMGV